VPESAAASKPLNHNWRTLDLFASPSLLLGVAAAPANPAHAWAVGWTGSATATVPLLAAWRGANWSKVRLLPGVVSSLGKDPVLDTAAASSPTNVWAFTESGRWLRFNGTTWTAGRTASPAPVIQASLATGSSSAWAFGGTAVAGRQTTYLPYASLFTAGHGWKRTAVPGKGMIVSASAVSGTDIWAVIGTGPLGLPANGSGLVHWQGGRWQPVISLPAALHNSSLGAVLARSDTDVWVGGAARNTRGGTTEVVGHWNGHSWLVSRFGAPASAAMFHVTSLVPDGAGGIWALGFCVGPNWGGAIAGRLWHQVAGRWIGPRVPVLANRKVALVRLAPVAHSVWAVGDAGVGGRRPSGVIALWGPVP
jgi:hypothetical protein